MSESVQAAVLTAPSRIELQQRSLLSPKIGEVELRVGYVGVCGSDIEAFAGRRAGSSFPIVLGHEFSAQVVHLGAEANNLVEGQWVSVAPLLTCGRCEMCRTGNEHLCSQRRIFGMDVDGALRERLVMPARDAIPLPDGVSPLEGSLVEPLAVAVHAVERPGEEYEGLNVLISGAGAIGLLIAQVVEQRGANTIGLIDINHDRLDLAKEMGFATYKPGVGQTIRADRYFIATGASQALVDATQQIAPHGRVIVVGIMKKVTLDYTALLMKEATITTSRYFTMKDFQEAIRLLEQKTVNTHLLIEDQGSFSDLFEAGGREMMHRAKQAVRLVLKI